MNFEISLNSPIKTFIYMTIVKTKVENEKNF